MRMRALPSMIAVSALFILVTGCATPGGLIEECAESSSQIDDICDLDPDSDQRQDTLNECSEAVGYANGRRCLTQFASLSSCVNESLNSLNDCDDLFDDLDDICAYEQGVYQGCIEDD